MFSWKWCALYAALPVAIAWLLGRAAIADPNNAAIGETQSFS